MQIFTDEEMSQKFFDTGSFAEGTVFWLSDQNDNESRVLWQYACPICMQDEYAQQGLCTGVFNSRISNLLTGKRSCRCSGKFQYTKEQQEYRIKGALKDAPSVTFVGWMESFRGSNTRVSLNCAQHGTWSTGLSNVLWSKTRCASCAKHGFNKTIPAYVYVILVGKDDAPEFTGYGITNNIKIRLQAHKSMLKRHGYKILDISHIKTTGTDANLIESKIKESWDLFSQDIDGFRKEATYTDNYDDIKIFLEGY